MNRLDSMLNNRLEEPNEPTLKQLMNEKSRRAKNDKKYGGFYHWTPAPMLRSVRPHIPQMAGGELGALAGGGLGFMIGGPLGALGGSMLGAGGGGAGGQYLQARGIERRELKPNELENAFQEEYLSELAGRGIGKGLQKIAKPFRKKLIQGAPEMARLAKKYGTHLTPGQLTDAWTADTLETIADASFFGGRRMKTLKLMEQPEAIGRYADDIADMFTRKAGAVLDPDSIGKLVNESLGENNKIFMKQASALYDKVDKLTKGSQVNISSLKTFAKSVLGESEELAGIGASEAGDTLLSKIMKLGGDNNTVSFKAAQELRSRLIAEETALATTKDKGRGIAKKLISLTNQAIDVSGKNLSPEAIDAFRLANRFYKQGKEKYANKVIRNLIHTVEKRGEPEKIIPYIFQPKAVSRIKKTKVALGANSPAWNSLKAKYVESLLSVKPDKLIGSNIPNDLFKMGNSTLKEIFNPTELDALRKLGDWSNLIGGKASRRMATGGSMVVQLVQGGAVVGLLSGHLQKEAVPVFIGPEVMAQLITRKSSAKWLTTGFDIPVRTPEGMALAVRLVNAVKKANRDIQKERMKNANRFRYNSSSIYF